MFHIVGHWDFLADDPLPIVNADQVMVQVLSGSLGRIRHYPSNRSLVLACAADNHLPKGIRRFDPMRLQKFER